ncbi:uncharacterized protein LOC105703976 [Orussus abietinus]|uniref:uncharacterized protein LOC105703976 n=1 Tax=Orussus abietinus TaxID=222816 RepID=UPI000626C0CB|nr:uncharacterized protein LOC105703976 [Orussus abietinus]
MFSRHLQDEDVAVPMGNVVDGSLPLLFKFSGEDDQPVHQNVDLSMHRVMQIVGKVPKRSDGAQPINWTIHRIPSQANQTCHKIRITIRTAPEYLRHVQSADRHLTTMIHFVILAASASLAVAAPQWGYHGAGYHGAHVGGPPAPLGPDGRVVDTPEVAQLKAAHLSALAEAHARAPKGSAIGTPYEGYYGGHDGSYAPRYSGPPAPLGPDGRVVDTPEVQQAKAVHFSLYSAEAQKVPSGPENPGHGSWGGDWNPAYDHHY